MANILTPVMIQDLTELTAKGFINEFSDEDALVVIASLNSSQPPYKMKISEIVKLFMLKSNFLVEVGSIITTRKTVSNADPDEATGIIQSCKRVNTGMWEVFLKRDIKQGVHFILPISCGAWESGDKGGYLSTDFSATAVNATTSKFKIYTGDDDTWNDMSFSLKIYEKITSISQL